MSVSEISCFSFLVVFSVSEISHDLSEKYIPCGKPPSREFASSLRFLAKTNLASSFGGSVGNADDRGSYVILSVISIQKAGGVKFSPRPLCPLCGLTPFVYGKSVAVVIDYGGIARGKEIAYYLFGDKRFHVMLNKPF